MLHIIEISEQPCKAVQTWGSVQPPEGYAILPERLLQAYKESKGFVFLSIEDGVVTSLLENMEAREAWEREYPPVPPTPSPEEDRDALLVDLDYRMTLVELGVM